MIYLLSVIALFLLAVKLKAGGRKSGFMEIGEQYKVYHIKKGNKK